MVVELENGYPNRTIYMPIQASDCIAGINSNPTTTTFQNGSNNSITKFTTVIPYMDMLSEKIIISTEHNIRTALKNKNTI